MGLSFRRPPEALNGEKACSHCSRPTGRDGRARYCLPCAPIVKKLKCAAWQDANPDRTLAYHRKYNARLFQGVAVNCASEGCPNKFIRSRRQARRVFCDSCFLVYYGARDLRLRKPEVAA